MNTRKGFQKYRYLIIASGIILIAMLALVLMQYRLMKQTELLTRTALEANLDTHLQALVDEAKRDMIEHSNHIVHSLPQRRVRERDLPRLARAFALATRRYPEIESFYVIFFDREDALETWQVLHYLPQSADLQEALEFEGKPVGKFISDAELTGVFQNAWQMIPNRPDKGLHTVTSYAPVSPADPAPQQIFFHPVYESDSLERQTQLNRVGLIAFTARAESYPAPEYWENLVRHHEKSVKSKNDTLGAFTYTVDFYNGREEITPAENAAETPERRRGFDPADRLFPHLSFGVILREKAIADYAGQYSRSSILLSLGACVLCLLGLGLTWRAIRREMKVAQVKSDFLANMSHELKTPLTAIRAFGDLLHTGRARDAERIREYGGMIKTESDRLTGLINNILELSRLERGIRRYRLRQENLSETIAQTIEVFRHTAQSSGFRLELKLPETPVHTDFDEGAIRQAILNLLTNAVKYSGQEASEKCIEITVWTNDTDAFIEVRDHGAGIEPAQQKHIFEAFHRASQPEIQSKQGTGLGLAIVREIVRAHGGDISVESRPGLGAAFCFRLPLTNILSQKVQEPKTEENKDVQHSGRGRRTERGYRAA